MAIEIKELHVRLTIGDEQTATTHQEETKKETQGCSGNDTTNQEVMVAETVKEVLRILKEQKER